MSELSDKSDLATKQKKKINQKFVDWLESFPGYREPTEEEIRERQKAYLFEEPNIAS